MARFVVERVIAAPPDRVYAASLDHELHVRSMARFGETMMEAPAGGIFVEGSTVTWRARHFGIPFRLRSVVFGLDPPRRFCDRQIAGPFASFVHQHEFDAHPDGTLMRDTVALRSPFGPLGLVVDLLFMRKYMRRLIDERNDVVAVAAEARS